MHRVLITGGSGFIGSHLAERLVVEGTAVRVFDARSYPFPPPEGTFETALGTLTVLSEVQEAVRDCDGIVHLGGVSRSRDGYAQPWRCVATNVMGTVSVLEAVRQASTPPWIVLGSTREVPAIPSRDANFPNIYGISKFAAELCARRYAEDYGLRVLTLRFADTYGSSRDQPDKVLPLFVNRALRGLPIIVHNPSEQFDFTYYEDIISGIFQGAVYLASGCDSDYSEMTLSTGQTVTLLELAETIVAELGSTSRIEAHSLSTAGGGRALFNDSSRARAVLGFRPQVSLREGIRRLAAVLANDTEPETLPPTNKGELS